MGVEQISSAGLCSTGGECFSAHGHLPRASVDMTDFKLQDLGVRQCASRFDRDCSAFTEEQHIEGVAVEHPGQVADGDLCDL